MATQRRSRTTTSKTAPRPSRSKPDPAAVPARSEVAPSQTLPNKGEKLYYRIGEVAKITGVKAYVLRYWESEFRWMAPQKSRSKQRLYRRKDIDTILLIKKLLYEERYTIAGARKLLREMGVGGTAEASLAKTLDHRSEYRRIRDELVAIRAAL
jgi:DNA-binding transcriptional MerR regulator